MLSHVYIILVDTYGGRNAYQVTLDGGVDDLCQHVLVREAHHKPVLRRVVLVLVLQKARRAVRWSARGRSERADALESTIKQPKQE